MVDLKIKKLSPDATVPTRADAGSSGWDLYASEEVIINAGERKVVATGLAMEVPVGYEIQIRPRSGIAAKQGITVLNTPGTIDASYRGEVKVILVNTTSLRAKPDAPIEQLAALQFQIKKGDRIAQAVVMKLPEVTIVETEELSDTSRGAGGFGSSGK